MSKCPQAAAIGLTDFAIEYQDPLSKQELGDHNAEQKKGLARFLASGRYPLEQRIENKKRGIGRQKYPFVGM